MSRKRRKRPKQLKFLHYFIALQDREAWGSSTMCSGKGAGTPEYTKVTCKQCLTYTDYDLEQYESQCSNPLRLT